MEENFTVGIIGGAGKMGRFFKKFFEKKGYPVLISDKDEGLSLKELLEKSKVILLSLPMEVFPEVVKNMAPLVREEHWILDICSLKLEPARTMKKYLKKGELLATHPLFGPYEKDLSGKIVALYPLRGKNCYSWFSSLLQSEGMKVVKISPKKHDEIMGLVQVVNHFWLILLGNLIKDSGFSVKEILDLSTPSFLSQLKILMRLAWQEENLYARIQLENPFGKKFRNLLCKNCKNLARTLNKEDKESYEAFKEYFLSAKEIAAEIEKLLSSEIEKKPKS
ncbi:MAG: prephenate dehydrogenase/arogenate dehydrogenase family protein [Caldimicrobium sp.]